MNRILIFVFTIMACLNLWANGTNQDKKQILYTFPLKKEWKSLDTPDKRKEMLQIPSVMLPKIPTEELMDICLDYPFLIELCLDDNYQKNFDL